MKLMMATLALLAMAAAPVDETKIGAGVTLTEATPIAAIARTPADYVGKTVRVDGVATAVCEMMGCWMAVAESDAKDAPVVRLQVDHDGAIVFPMSAKGKKVSAQGVVEAATAEGDAHDAGEHATHATHEPPAADKYQIKATGAIIR